MRGYLGIMLLGASPASRVRTKPRSGPELGPSLRGQDRRSFPPAARSQISQGLSTKIKNNRIIQKLANGVYRCITLLNTKTTKNAVRHSHILTEQLKISNTCILGNSTYTGVWTINKISLLPNPILHFIV